MKLIVIDYDGVIADSQLEGLFSGFNTYLKFHKNTKLFGSEKFTFNNFNSKLKAHKKIVVKYKNLRPFLVDAFSYYVMMHTLENNLKVKNQNTFNKLRDNLKNKFYYKYFNSIYKFRKNLQKTHLNEWLNLQKPYSKILSGLKNLSKKFPIVILTNNKESNVELFCKKHRLFPKLIIGSEKTRDKRVRLIIIKKKFNCNYRDIHFIDDQVNHFNNIKNLDINCYLATWGYNFRDQQKEAKKLGATLLTYTNFYKTLK